MADQQQQNESEDEDEDEEFSFWPCFSAKNEECGCIKPLKASPCTRKGSKVQRHMLQVPQCPAHGHHAEQGFATIVDRLKKAGYKGPVAVQWPLHTHPSEGRSRKVRDITVADSCKLPSHMRAGLHIKSTGQCQQCLATAQQMEALEKKYKKVRSAQWRAEARQVMKHACSMRQSIKQGMASRLPPKQVGDWNISHPEGYKPGQFMQGRGMKLDLVLEGDHNKLVGIEVHGLSHRYRSSVQRQDERRLQAAASSPHFKAVYQVNCWQILDGQEAATEEADPDQAGPSSEAATEEADPDQAGPSSGTRSQGVHAQAATQDPEPKPVPVLPRLRIARSKSCPEKTWVSVISDIMKLVKLDPSKDVALLQSIAWQPS